jgi:hypothetical protein
VKFVFPSASIYEPEDGDGHPTQQWFKIRSLEDPLADEEAQIEGLRQIVSTVHQLIVEEVILLGEGRTY